MANLGKVMLTPKGNYNSGVTYQRLDSVVFNSSSWTAKQTTLGHEPSEGDYWTLLAQGFNGADAGDVGYDNTESGLEANNVQEAIDELKFDMSGVVKKVDVAINAKNPPIPLNYAVGNGVTDDTVALNGLIDFCKLNHLELYLPPTNPDLSEYYLVSGTLNIDASLKIRGVDVSLPYGSIIKQTANLPLFHITAPCTLEKLVLRGMNSGAFTNQDGIFIDGSIGVNDVSIREVNFFDFYNDVHIKDTVFYSYFSNCKWYSCIHAMIYGEGTSHAGYAFEINDCQVIASTGQYGFLFENAGSIMIDNLMMSPQNLTVSGLTFKSLAPGAGISQISNSGFEPSNNHAVELIGTASNPIKFIFFSNCYMGANTHTVYAEYAYNVHFNNCYLTGSILLYAKYVMDAIYLTSCEYQSTNKVITCDQVNCYVFGVEVVSPSYGNSFPFISIPSLSYAAIKRISVTGGTIGTNANPIDYPALAESKVHIEVMGQNLNPIKFKRFVGTLDSSGNANVSTSIDSVNSKVIDVKAFFHNGNYIAQPLNIPTINGTHVSLTGGTASGKYRLTVIYTEKDDTNWF